MAELHVYIAKECWACAEARRIVAEVTPQFPGLEVELRDLNDARRPDNVFATPTYVLDGQTIFLGNPTQEELMQKLPPPS